MKTYALASLLLSLLIIIGCDNEKDKAQNLIIGIGHENCQFPTITLKSFHESLSDSKTIEGKQYFGMIVGESLVEDEGTFETVHASVHTRCLEAPGLYELYLSTKVQCKLIVNDQEESSFIVNELNTNKIIDYPCEFQPGEYHLTIVSRSQLADLELVEVPIPTFQKPVDYLSWYKSNLKPANLITDTVDGEMETLLNIGWRISPSIRENLDDIISNPRLWKQDEQRELSSYLESIETYSSKYLNGYYNKKPIYLIKGASSYIYEIEIYNPSRMLCKAVIADIWNNEKFTEARFVKGIESIFSDAYRLKHSYSAMLFLEAYRLEEWALISIQQANTKGLLSKVTIKAIAEIISDAGDLYSHGHSALLRSCFDMEKAFKYEQLQSMVTDSMFSSKPSFHKGKVKDCMELYGLQRILHYKAKLNTFLQADPEIVANDINAYFNDGIKLIENSEMMNATIDLNQKFESLRNDILKDVYFQAFIPYNFSELYEQFLKTTTIFNKVCDALRE